MNAVVNNFVAFKYHSFQAKCSVMSVKELYESLPWLNRPFIQVYSKS